ncbi:YbhB/YbcL family Raf kinase inhibitor-like protein [Pantoea sp. Z09]|uniref:YbhB/YbcL family Raf kinase inhibitor-like protein n=1 Tax=Pantoea sp. Z09 TaxID=2886821 RepID=UPI001EFE5EDD|nr:YbhB/YbcL family Raf kinase inhibitor-like protein [Pantoea sp. Z09]
MIEWGSVLFQRVNIVNALKKIIAAGILSILSGAAQANPPVSFKLSSPEIKNGHFENSHLSSAALGLGCVGGNRSPALEWEHAPAGTQSFVLEIFDKDAPTGHGWVHWTVVNIPASSHALAAGIGSDNKGLPLPAFQTRTDFGIPGYGGPCPPAGQTHHYVITLKALNIATLPHVTADATPALVGYLANMNILAAARLEVIQSR